MIAVADRHQQQSVCLLLGIRGNRLSAKQFKHLFPVHLQLIINMPLLGILEDLRLRESLGRADRADPGITVHIHEAQGTEPVEPEIGDSLNNGLPGTFIDLFPQLRDGLFLLAQLGAVGLQDKVKPCSDLFNELASCRLGEFFKLGCIHLLSF